MQNKLAPYLLSALMTLLCISGFSQAVYINQPFNDTLQCVNGTFNVPYTVNGSFRLNNIFRVVLSDINGNFTSSSPNIGFGYGDQSGVATCTLPTGLTLGSGYRVRIEADSPTFQSNPYISGDNGSDIRISPYPIINTLTSNSPVCAGDTLKLNATSNVGNAEYDWTGPSGYTDTGHNAARSNAPLNGSGTYKVTVTAFGCATSDTISTLVSPPPVKPVATTNSPVCERGDLEMVSHTPTPGVTSKWVKLGGSQISSFPNHIIKNVKTASTGTYVIIVKIGNCSASDTITAIVKPAPDTPTASNNGPICEGDTLRINANTTTPGSTYKWTGPNGFSSTQQNPVKNYATLPDDGTYTVIAIKDGCESLPGTTNVKIGNSITIPAIIGDSLLCPGDTLELTTRGGSGIFKWVLPNGNDYLGGAIFKPNISASDAGEYFLTVTQNGCVSPPGKITVKVPDLKQPKPTNNGPICENETLELNIEPTTGGSYSWRGPNNFATNSVNISLSNIEKTQAGYYYITASLDYCSVTDSTEVVINEIPLITDISNSGPICYGAELNLYAQADNSNATYSWTGPNAYRSNLQNPSIVTGIPGTYTVTATAEGCTSIATSTDVGLKEGPTPPDARNNGPVKEGEPIELTAGDSKQGTSFTWKGPDNYSSTVKDPLIDESTILHAGTYTVTATYNGCSLLGSTTVQIIGYGSLSVELFPNANNGKFYIQGIIPKNIPYKVAVVSLYQRVIYLDVVEPVNKKFKKEIDLGDIPSGDYYLVLDNKVIPFAVVRQ